MNATQRVRRLPPAAAWIRTQVVLMVACVALVWGCGEGKQAPAADPHVGEEATPPTNRIDVPPAVRRNLGITFVRVERRTVDQTIRLPGVFEARREAHRAYPASLAGQVELHTEQYTRVETGDLLFRVQSPAWQAMQAEIADLVRAVRETKVAHEAAKREHTAALERQAALEHVISVWRERLAEIEDLAARGSSQVTQRAEAQAALANARSELAAFREEHAIHDGTMRALAAKLAGYRDTAPVLAAEALGESPGAEARDDLLLARAATLLGVAPSVLAERDEAGRAGWRRVTHLEVHAGGDGVVEALEVESGAWVEAGTLVLRTIDPTDLRFRAAGLQGDLARLPADMSGRILPPGGITAVGEATLPATVSLGLEADPALRTIDLLARPEGALPAWARAGVSTEIEIVLAGGRTTLAIPLSSVIGDGLERVLFRRDPKDPNKVIRLEADLGIDDGHWVVVESGLIEGDEVVLEGVYELMLASSSGGRERGGHFHADGTYHEGDH